MGHRRQQGANGLGKQFFGLCADEVVNLTLFLQVLPSSIAGALQYLRSRYFVARSKGEDGRMGNQLQRMFVVLSDIIKQTQAGD